MRGWEAGRLGGWEALLLALVLAGCSAAGSPTSQPPSLPASQPSLYTLALPLTDQSGAPTTLDAFRGHPTVIAMFYTACPTACPMMIEAIRDITKDRPDARVLLVSFDPAHDTPAALTAEANAHHLDPTWRLTAPHDDDAVRVLAAALGVRYRNDHGAFVHSTTIALLDADGRIAEKADDLASARAELPAAIARLTP